MPNNSSCAYSMVHTADLRLVLMDVLVGAVNIPIGAFIVVSCVVVLTVIRKMKQLQTPANLILCSLTTSDLLGGLVSVPMFVALMFLRIRGINECVDMVLAAACSYSMYLSAGGSLVQISVFSWDRWKALSQPLLYKTQVTRLQVMTVSGACWVVWIAWLTAILYAMPERMRDLSTAVTCCALVLSPVLFHFALSVTLRRQFRKMATSPNARYMQGILRREHRITVTLRYIIGAFLACLLPVMFIWVAYIAGVTSLRRHAFPWAVTLAFLNSCLNPIIYFWRIPGMRRAAVEHFCCRSGQC